MTDKEKIKEEIERRYNCEKCYPNDREASVAAAVLYELLLFIDSIPEEPVSEDLEEEITKCYKSRNDLMMTRKQFGELIRHFAEWQRKKDEQLPNVHHRDNLDEYAYQCAYDMSNDWAIDNPTWKNVQTSCKLGAEWQKNQMMKDAVDAEVFIDYNINFGYGSLTANIDLDEQHLKEGDKVKIVIVKEE